jgi:hypothetical protein
MFCLVSYIFISEWWNQITYLISNRVVDVICKLTLSSVPLNELARYWCEG